MRGISVVTPLKKLGDICVDKLSNKDLIESCNKAIELNLEPDFIRLLKEEMERRGL